MITQMRPESNRNIKRKKAGAKRYSAGQKIKDSLSGTLYRKLQI